MKLMDTTEVCDFLGISKSTLYRWCDVSEPSLGWPDSLPNRVKLNSIMKTNHLYGRDLFPQDETPSDFPKPFRIGRAYKWKDEDIMAWLETRRV